MFTVLVILARALSRPAYATTVLFILVVTLGGTVVRCGLPKSCVRAVASALAAEGREQADRVARTGVLTVGFLAVVAIPVSSLVVHFLALGALDDPTLARLSWFVGLVIAVEGYQLTVAEIFRGFHRVGSAVLLGYAARSALLLLAVLGLAVGNECSVEHVMWAYLACDVVPAVVGSFRLYRLTRSPSGPTQPFELGVARHLVGVGVTLAVVEMTTFFLTQGDSLVVGAVATHTDTALYNTASRLANLLAIPYFATSLVLPPIVAGLWATGQRGRLERTVRTGAFIGAAPVAIVYLIAVVLARPLFGAVFGTGYRGAALYFIVLGVGPVLNAATGAAVTVLTMVGEQRLVAIATVVVTCLTVGAEVELGREFGAIGVAAASAVGTIVSNVTLSVAAWRRANVRTWLYLRPSKEARRAFRTAFDTARGFVRGGRETGSSLAE